MKAIVTYALTNLFLVFALINAEAAPATWPQSINQHAIAAQGDSVYLVKQGDTYYSLSRRFNIPLDSLQKWNNNTLQIGQTLYLSRQSMALGAKQKLQTTAPKAAKATPATTKPATSTSAAIAAAPRTAEHKDKSRVMIIPFDPYLYFSDADDEIANKSKIPRQNVRHVFRSRLNALLAPEGYETIHLLGGVYRDSVSELSRLYKSLSYGYQDNKQSKYNSQPVVKDDNGGALDWVQRQKEKLGLEKEEQPVSVAQDPSKHFGVAVKDPNFFSYFNNQYGIDYYVFINQFEVKTNYENCLDRAALNYERDFMVHYSIYNSKGELVSGNKVKIAYQSNMNDVQRIVSDNMPVMAKRVLSDLPPSGK
ncbi:LysM repeat protein [Pontibacter aydingkolensis]|uniref:LysM peptidoglycan-binding domain-containing protein n=1 Tax=Pontibacter aydingkolensis TaxID=1911536 RepID=A0ABS7CNR7_9BACT|nr:LysM domain-containing protein [Pontibacter aydingkolensis]MBW7465504.1 LysM peptidoglycan-binding domain-containing protein [Pontibacter aydingkolensis]